VKGGKAPTRLEPALVLNDESGRPHQNAQDILQGKAALLLATP